MKLSKSSGTTPKSTTPWQAPLRPFAKPWVPRPDQRKGMKFLLESACGVLAADPGVGKTTCVYGAFKVLRKQQVATKLLVVAPLKPCYLVWPKEADKWIDFHGLKVVVLHDKTKDEDLIADADVCIINPDGLDWLTGAHRKKNAAGKVSVEVDLKRFKSFGFDTLVIDELTRFKHYSSGRFKVLKAVHHTFARRWGLTGSLAANGLMNLFGQYLMIDGGRSFGPYITHFRRQYFVPGYNGFSWDLAEGAEAKIRDRVAPLTLRLEAKDLPEEVPVLHTFPLPPDVRRIYDALEDDLIAKIGTKTVTAASAGVASIKCRQVASGGLYLEPETVEVLGTLAKASKRDWAHLHDEKTDLVESLVEELQGSPLIVVYEFHHDLDRLLKRFPGTPNLGSGVSPKQMKEIEAAWNRDELPLLFGHPQTMALGLNLQDSSSRHICWYSQTWDYELDDQLVRRLRRSGSQAKQIFVHRLLAEKTVDMLQLRALGSKAKVQGDFHDQLLAMQGGRHQK